VEAPSYGSAASLARSTGADVSLWRRRYEDGWAHDVDALAALIEMPYAAAGFDAAEWRRRLAEMLEAYAVPQWIVAVPHIPRNENDKVDREAAAALLETSIGNQHGSESAGNSATA